MARGKPGETVVQESRGQYSLTVPKTIVALYELAQGERLQWNCHDPSVFVIKRVSGK